LDQDHRFAVEEQAGRSCRALTRAGFVVDGDETAGFVIKTPA
jgi:hypothetical protein